MEAVGVLGGGAPCVYSSSILLRSSTDSTTYSTSTSSLSYAQCKKLNLRTSHLAAFHSPSRLFCHSHSRSYNAKSRNSTKTHIFLPHLVASLEQVEETYIMVKPDGVQRGLVGEIISRFEKKGFKLTGLKLFQCPKELAEEHYKDLKARPFFPKLIDYITSGPVVCMAWEGVGVVASARKLIGSTDPLQAEPGTIRGDLAVQTGRNVVHGSDSPENGKREVALWFKEGEICQWPPALAPWLRE
ncbi:nucleoside diphosphate kinase 2, chloroplastic [Ricinus communis]|uniref:Nucleoside diphosphate kinase n=1 Tax=Ricinus communis TaxID=3988 RepID=B9RAM1_RICCO|nr:nucleoside diphosphate kinase 2, chloroplastic [Ricinus communis]EEF51848.1 nucleoside diphosphate kinase, putative [Ricinus communis]|eukprot:XP_002511246.1 nucleoside diphosphate kinase 2, chloroplastic [Ricinus communis]